LIGPLEPMPFATEDAAGHQIPLPRRCRDAFDGPPVATASEVLRSRQPIGLTPVPGSIGNAMSPTAAYEHLQMAALGLQPRSVPDGGGSFARERVAVEQVGEPTSMIDVGRRRRRIIVIIASAALAVVAGVVLVIVLGNRHSEPAPGQAPPREATSLPSDRTARELRS
jgi:hypothetical protein